MKISTLETVKRAQAVTSLFSYLMNNLEDVDLITTTNPELYEDGKQRVIIQMAKPIPVAAEEEEADVDNG